MVYVPAHAIAYADCAVLCTLCATKTKHLSVVDCLVFTLCLNDDGR